MEKTTAAAAAEQRTMVTASTCTPSGRKRPIEENLSATTSGDREREMDKKQRRPLQREVEEQEEEVEARGNNSSPSKSSSSMGTNDGTSSQQEQQPGNNNNTTTTLPITSKKFSDENLKILNECYKENTNPTAKCLRAIARKSGLTHLQCKAWFQYQRKKKRKHILENQSETLYKEIKVLVEDIEKAKERNVVLLTENNTLRKNVHQWNSYQEQFSAVQPAVTAKPIKQTIQVVNGTPTTLVGGGGGGTTTLQEAKARLGLGTIVAAALSTPPSGDQTNTNNNNNQTSPNSDSDQTQHRHGLGGKEAVRVPAAINLDVNTTDVPGQIASNVSEYVKRSSRVVTRVLSGERKNEAASQAVIHSSLAIHVRTLIAQSENPLGIVTVLMKSFDSMLSQNAKSEAEREVELRPLLDSFVKTELAIKDAQLATKVNLMAQLPPLPPLLSNNQQQKDTSKGVSVDSILCVFNQCYLGEAERSLCLMGESSLYALFSQAYDLINLENASLPFQHVVLLNKFKEALKKEEEELVRKFEVTWHLPYAFAQRHRDPLMRSHIQRCQDKLHLSVSKTLAEAVAVYKKGVVECYKNLPAMLCARVFLAMHKVKQILRTSDSFFEISTCKVH